MAVLAGGEEDSDGMGTAKNGKGQGPDKDGDPGAGGVSRGRADAEMTWGEESQGRTDLFQPKLLDPSAPRSQGFGEARRERDHARGEGRARVEHGRRHEGVARHRRVAPAPRPHHRDAVKSYFSQEKQK